MTFITSSAGPDVDVETNILCARFATLRRAIGKRPHLDELARYALNGYIANNYVATDVSNVEQNLAEVAPMPGKNNRAPLKPYYEPHGPIGLILVQVHEKAAAISTGFNVHAFGWPTSNALKCPYA